MADQPPDNVSSFPGSGDNGHDGSARGASSSSDEGSAEPRRKRTGRPTKLTPEMADRILGYVRMGVPNKAAAEAAGIGRTTFYAWKAKGEAAASGHYRDFTDALKQAEAESVVALVAAVRAAPQWQAAMTLLERRWPAEFGRRDRIEVENINYAQAIEEEFGYAPEEIAKTAERLRSIGRGA